MRKEQIIGLIFLGISLLLNLFLSLFRLDFSIWLDEAVSLKFASLGFFEILSKSMILDNHGPIYYGLLHIWIKIFGNSEIATRMLSIIFGLLSIVLFYFILEIMNKKKSCDLEDSNSKFQNKLYYFENFLSVFLISISFSIIQQQRDIRMYTLLLMFAALSTLLLALYVKFNKITFLILYTISSIFFVYTHICAVFLFPIHIFYFIIKKRKALNRNVLYISINYFVILLSMIPIFILLFRLTQATFLINSLTFERFLGIIYSFFSNRPFWITSMFILFISLFGIYYVNKYKFETTIFTLIAFLLPFVLIFIYEKIFNSIFNTKYIIYIYPIGMLLVAKSISNFIELIYSLGMKIYQFIKNKMNILHVLVKKLRISSKGFLLSISLIFLVTFSSVIAYSSYDLYIGYYQNPAREDWKSVALYIKENSYSNDNIFIESGFCEDPFMYYYDSYISNSTNIIRISFTNSTNIISSLENYLNISRVWYILSHSRDYDDEIYNWANSFDYIRDIKFSKE